MSFRKKAFLFSLDALLASLIMIGSLLIIIKITTFESDTVQLSAAGQDILSGISAISLTEVQDPWIQANIANGSITDPNASVIEQIGYYWALNQIDDAKRLANITFVNLYPEFGLRFSIEGVVLYEKNSTKGSRDIITATRMMSGIVQGEAVTGSSAVAYLKRIKDKRTASYTYFGGFVGQGNISVRFLDLPSDANITDIYLELASGAPFKLYFNSVACGGTYTPPFTNGTPYSWDLTSCNTSLVPGGINNVTINYTTALNTSYITGGFLRVKYKTATLSGTINETFAQYRFPGIQGIVNLYDAFYVPGTLLNLSVYLHYNASNSTYFDIGDKRVWEDAPNNTEYRVILNDSYLKNASLGKLDYNFLSNKTVPIRMAGFSPNETIVTSGDADVVLITDFTGSMKKAVDDWDQGNLGSDCDSAYSDSDVRRTLLAQCVDKELVDTVMNFSGNRIWPVFIYDDEIRWYNNPTSKAGIKGYIDSFPNGKGKTCISCAINLANDILLNFSNSSRKKFIIIMTDGCPTHCPSGNCSSLSTFVGAKQCEGLCDTAGACDETDIPSQCTECTTTGTGAQNSSYISVNVSRIVHNATVYTVGFGPLDDCAYGNETMKQIALLGNGTYQHSKNSTQLRLIYDNISQSILSQTTLVAQVASAVGPQSSSILFDDSYINITYSLASQYQPMQNLITVTLQTPQACNPVVPLFAEQRLIEAKAISYSGTHWTDYVAVNGVEAFNLSTFLLSYGDLGDPTVVQVANSLFSNGNNTITLETGDSQSNRTGCSLNNSVTYIVGVNLSTERSVVVPNTTGCIWTVQFEDNTVENITIPSTYTGSLMCSYQSGNISYNGADAYQLGAYLIFERLDFRKDGKLYVDLRDEDIEVIVTTISRIPYMWGPSVATLEVIR